MIKNITTIRIALCFCAWAFVAQPAMALENVGGQIASVYVAGGTNYGYRVNLVGKAACSSGGFGYINEVDSNYKVFVANLMMAYTLGKQVSLITEVVNGYCHIVEVWVY